jgi:hypothetical protein
LTGISGRHFFGDLGPVVRPKAVNNFTQLLVFLSSEFELEDSGPMLHIHLNYAPSI